MWTMRPILLCLSFAAIACTLAGSGCKKPSGQLRTHDYDRGQPVRVLATTGMIADATQVVGGDRVQVDCLMGPGIDPHLFVPRPDHLTRIQQAHLVLYNGLHLEGKMTDIFADRGRTDWTVAVAEGLPDLRQAEVGFEGTYDPHVWFDVRLWMKCVEKIRDTLVEIDPLHADIYRTNATQYLSQLAALDSEVREKIARLPTERRVLVTAHDAFGYFGRAYSFEVRGLQGVSTAGDTSGRDVQELADLIGTRKIKAVFTETSVPDKGMKAVMEAVRSKYKGFEVRLAEDKLYSDALGAPGSGGETYVGMVRHNVDAIVRALGD
jgi:manganese/zinc/iron transport system substrate-binding protein